MAPLGTQARRVRIVVVLAVCVAVALSAFQPFHRHLTSAVQSTANLRILRGSASDRNAGPDPYCVAHPEQCAYAAMLCDDELLPALRVLIYSVHETESPHPFVVLVLPEVSEAARAELAAIAEDVIPVPQLAYPYDGKVKFELGINKQCRYSKLHLWSQSQFKSLIYLDVDTAVQKNIDHLFSTATNFAGVRDLGDVTNTGVLVLKPSDATYQDMLDTYLTAPSYNRGDQGFLNWYFSNRTTAGVRSLPPAYNVPPKLKGFAIGKKLIEDAFVYHFTAETKPWSFHSFYHGDWRLNYHPKMFASWRKMQYEFHELHPELGDHYALPRDSTEVKQQLASYDWPNRKRQYDLCHKYNPKYETAGKFPIQDQYSVAISYYNPERMQYLPKLIQHYLASERVHTVFITWHSAEAHVSPELKALVSQGRVKIVKQTSDTLNNRFNPIPGLKTQAVFVCDDDIFTPMTSVDFMFQTWKHRPDQIAGYFPRIHGIKPDGSIYYEMAGKYHRYSIILTKAMMINANFLHAYTCVLAPEIHRFVDMGKNCEDIAMNMMVSGLTGLPPVCIDEHEVLDFGTSRGISISSAFTHRRDQCTADLIQLFGRDTLVESREFVRPFDSNKFRKVKWEELDEVLEIEREARANMPKS
ncbi:hypothetical protein JCM8202_000936 [Rhodotorula sphaerocarpa]